ncbi:hypothetical protein KI387_036842 [Taxus chinensis]|uniref:Uncharacterized protein n=1 Tax=Taxus chinensis TaxID=29808 RepID=A0AA38KUX8_TAXCH|nr:hypothetical protein KI387_036842 [Taxus chinensis]
MKLGRRWSLRPRQWPPLALPWRWRLDFPTWTMSTPSLSASTSTLLITFDGHLLHNYLLTPAFFTDAVAIFSRLSKTTDIKNALNKITMEQGMPPASHPWVMTNIVEEALRSCDQWPAMTETEFAEALRKVLMEVASRLKTRPLRMLHTITVYDGKSIFQFLNNKHRLEKALQMTWKSLPKEEHGKLSREYVRVALDMLAPPAGLPPWGALQQMDEVVSQILMKMEDGGVTLNRKEFKKLMIEILSSIMHSLETSPISLSSNTLITHDSPYT